MMFMAATRTWTSVTWGQGLIRMEAGNLDVEIPPRSAAILVPADDQFKGYKFFKERNS